SLASSPRPPPASRVTLDVRVPCTAARPTTFSVVSTNPPTSPIYPLSLHDALPILNFAGPVTLAAFTFTGGTLGGTAAVTLPNPLTWRAEACTPATLDSANRAVTVNEKTGSPRLDGRSLTLGGAASTWSGGTIYIDN